IRAAARLERPRTVDFLPTLVSLARQPLSAELPGRVWEEALTAPPAGERIASYDGIRPDPSRRGAVAPAAGPGDAALLEQLRSLGYLAGAGERSPSGERNLAFVALRERRYREAARAFERLTRETPGDAGLHAGLASALAGLGREAQAREQFAVALALDPAHLPALVNRGLFEESLGNRDAAAADFRLALRIDPAHEPARRALARLGESGAAPRARTPEEAEAGERIAAGNAALRRGDYELARAEFGHARRLVPDAAGPLHGLSNVAYLTGDRAAATRFLEEALRREPDNPLFRANLERLRRASAAAPRPAAASAERERPRH
ncbi:MAG TPA: tetratricopeptide repeat protein, partial [Thermoanaerobaculia bacterium]|nr:tetratricopeptide repeat protein [Thermoanaerobaculia bacterium]